MAANRILLVDVGNTSISFGVGHGRRIVNVRRVDTGRCDAVLLKKALIEAGKGRAFSGAALCSVVPRLTKLCGQAIENVCGVSPLVVSHKLELGIGIDYPKPRTIGADRLANAAGAADRFGCPVVVADFGTALTFDIVSDSAAYIGGVIVPGLPFMTRYLADRTALLPHITLKGAHGSVGRSTEAAMRIGAKLGYRGMVREIFQHIRTEAGMNDAKLCATGGYAGWVLKGLDLAMNVEPLLTLYGLQVIYDLNR